MDFLNYDIIGSWLSAMCADSAPVACARTNKCAQDKRPRQTQQKTRFDYGFKDASLCPRKPQFQRQKTPYQHESVGAPAHKNSQPFSKLAALTLAARANPRHGQPSSNAADAPQICEEARAARPRTAKGQRHDCTLYHEGRIQQPPRQRQNGRDTNGADRHRGLREPDAEGRRR